MPRIRINMQYRIARCTRRLSYSAFLINLAHYNPISRSIEVLVQENDISPVDRDFCICRQSR